MLCPYEFYKELNHRGFDFFTGVPDSLLKSFCAVVDQYAEKANHVIAANEGNALSIAAGYYLAASKPAVVYMQNSGLGNIVNPLLSLTDSMVYKIPALLVIGWRGEPGVKDEPQHKRQGLITRELLDVLGISYCVIDENWDIDQIKAVLKDVQKYMNEQQQPYAFVIKKNTFSLYSQDKNSDEKYEMTRERALELITSYIEEDAVIVSTTGKTSRELFEIREKNGQTHSQDFLTVGSMGHCSQIALGISLVKENVPVYCVDGEGSVLMHMGSLAVNGECAGKLFTHIVINNGVHESVGGQPNSARYMDMQAVARACGYKYVQTVEQENELTAVMEEVKKHEGSCFVEIKVKAGSRKELGRPTASPVDNKVEFMQYLAES